jgi:hypothetical protein
MVAPSREGAFDFLVPGLPRIPPTGVLVILYIYIKAIKIFRRKKVSPQFLIYERYAENVYQYTVREKKKFKDNPPHRLMYVISYCVKH